MRTSKQSVWRLRRRKKRNGLLDAVSMDSRELCRSYATFLKHRNKVEQLLCQRCGKEILPGASMHAQVGHGRSGKPINVYHASCWAQLFMEF